MENSNDGGVGALQTELAVEEETIDLLKAGMAISAIVNMGEL